MCTIVSCWRAEAGAVDALKALAAGNFGGGVSGEAVCANVGPQAIIARSAVSLMVSTVRTSCWSSRINHLAPTLFPEQFSHHIPQPLVPTVVVIAFMPVLFDKVSR